MSQEQKLTGFIVKTQDLGEADLLLTFFTFEEGKLRFLAKSAKRMTSKLSGKLQPYFEIDITSVGNGGLPKLIGAEVVSEYAKLLDSQQKVQALSVLQELILRSLPDQQPNSSLYTLYKKSLDQLATEGDDSVLYIVVNFFVQSLKSLGFSPESVVTDAEDGKQIFFAMDTGKFLSKQNSLNDRPVSNLAHELYKQMFKEDFITDFANFNFRSAKELLEVLSTFTEYQLERDLKSAQYFISTVHS